MAEYKNGKLQLPNVTLMAMSSVLVPETIKAMEYSMRGIDFGAAVLITDERPKHLPETITYKHIDKLDNIDRFNYETVYHMGDYIDTEFGLLVHYDGFVVHPEMWRDEFLDYDYIGSPWPLPNPGDTTTYRDINGNLCRVGNSVSIRSKRLMDFPRKANIPWTPEKGWFNEDGFICCRIRHLIEADGMKIAPLEVAKYFGHENMIPEVQGITPFLFHKWAGTNASYPDFRKKHPVMDRIRRLHGTLHHAIHG
ncbi:MAG: DUF5672 family protein [Lachnospiraceae bacterium]|nr:DUF5672 family protein [Lachnospiraceae bacterium]